MSRRSCRNVKRELAEFKMEDHWVWSTQENEERPGVLLPFRCCFKGEEVVALKILCQNLKHNNGSKTDFDPPFVCFMTSYYLMLFALRGAGKGREFAPFEILL